MIRKYLVYLWAAFVLIQCGLSVSPSNGISGDSDSEISDPEYQGGTSTSTGNPSLKINYNFSNAKAFISPRTSSSSVILEKINLDDEIETAISVTTDDGFTFYPNINEIKKSPDGNFYVVFAKFFIDGDQLPCLFYRISSENKSQCVNPNLRYLRNLSFDDDGNVFYSGQFLIDRGQNSDDESNLIYSYRYLNNNSNQDIEIFSNVLAREFVSSDGYYFYSSANLSDTEFLFNVWSFDHQNNQQKTYEILAGDSYQDFIVGNFIELQDGSIQFALSQPSARGIYDIRLNPEENNFVLDDIVTNKTHPNLDRDCFFNYNGKFVEATNDKLFYLTFNPTVSEDRSVTKYHIKSLLVNPDSLSCDEISSSEVLGYVVLSDKVYYLEIENDFQKIYSVELTSGNFVREEIYSGEDYDLKIINSDRTLPYLIKGADDRVYLSAIRKSNSKGVLAYINTQNNNTLVISDDEFEGVPTFYFFDNN